MVQGGCSACASRLRGCWWVLAYASVSVAWVPVKALMRAGATRWQTPTFSREDTSGRPACPGVARNGGAQRGVRSSEASAWDHFSRHHGGRGGRRGRSLQLEQSMRAVGSQVHCLRIRLRARVLGVQAQVHQRVLGRLGHLAREPTEEGRGGSRSPAHVHGQR